MRGKKGPRDIMKKTVPQLQNTLWPLFALYIKQTHSDGEYVVLHLRQDLENR